jgi:hypothetical protein
VACGRFRTGGIRGRWRAGGAVSKGFAAAGVRDSRRRISRWRQAWGRSIAASFAGAGRRAVAGALGRGGGSLQYLLNS